MFASLRYAFDASNFEPHGDHFADTPILFWLIVVTNILTFVAYTLIPIVLVYFVYRRKDLMFHWVFLLFGAFIVLCGAHHLMHVITFWHPLYAWQGVVDAVTSMVSLATFVALLPVVPVALKLPNPQALNDLNVRLSEEVNTRRKAEEILRRSEHALREQQAMLSVKNEELEKLNQLMVGRELKMAELKGELATLKSRKHPRQSAP